MLAAVLDAVRRRRRPSLAVILVRRRVRRELLPHPCSAASLMFLCRAAAFVDAGEDLASGYSAAMRGTEKRAGGGELDETRRLMIPRH